MLIKIGNFEFTEVWDGVFYKKLSNYPQVSDWVYAIIVPTYLKKDVEDVIPSNLKDKVIYVENDCKDIWDWSEKVYRVVEGKEQ